MIFRKRLPKHCLIVDDPRFQPHFKPRKKSSLKWILILFIIGLVAIAATQLARAQSLQEESADFGSLSEPESGQILFPLASGGFKQAVHLNTTVNVDINGMVAKVIYSQRFKNDSDEWREAIYVFPLAENAAINHMEMRIGDRIIRSVIKEKAEAKKIYEQAKSQGKKTALTEQQRPNLFTQKLANIGPGEEIEIRLGYLQSVKYDSGAFSFYLPTTLTPRYMAGIALEDLEEEKHLASNPSGWATSWARPTDQVPDADKISPFMLSDFAGSIRNPMSIAIRLNPGLQLDKVISRNHSINQQASKEHQYEISLTNGHESMNRDFWLEWHPVAHDQPEAAVFKETFDGENFALLMLLPPQIEASKTSHLAREVIYIIDTSGSMGGESIRQAKASLLLALGRLTEQDRFNLIEFDSNHRTLFGRPVYATKEHIERARYFVNQLHADGGTNMAPALDEALSMPATNGFLKQVLFITDGAVGNEDHLFSLIKTKLGNTRLFTVGIGSAPNSHFMTRAAQFGRGTYEFISNQNEITERMSNLFRKLESPVLSNLQIAFPKSLEGAVEQFPQRLPDLYAGEPMVLHLKALNRVSFSDHLVISGTVATDQNKKQWTRHISLDGKQQHAGISTLWARKKIAALMDEQILGRDSEEVKKEILNVALPHKLISKYTSLVAVEERISRDPSEQALKPGALPNTVAKGSVHQLQPVSYPNTATWLPLNLMIANLSLLMLSVLYRRRIMQVFNKMVGLCLNR